MLDRHHSTDAIEKIPGEAHLAPNVPTVVSRVNPTLAQSPAPCNDASEQVTKPLGSANERTDFRGKQHKARMSPAAHWRKVVAADGASP